MTKLSTLWVIMLISTVNNFAQDYKFPYQLQ